MLYTNNDDVKEFGAANGYGKQYNDILLKWLRAFFGVTTGTLPDLLKRYNESWGEVMQPAAQHAVSFSEGVVPTLWSATSSTASTYIDSDGYIKTNGSAGMRFEYHPMTNEFQGILIEAASTNNALRSEELDNVYWSLSNGVVSNGILAPNNETDANLFTENSAIGARQLARTSILAVTTGQHVTLSCFFKAGSGATRFPKLTVAGTGFPSNANAVLNLATGEVSGAGANFVEALAQQFPNGWWRFSITALAAVNGQTNVFLRMVDSFNPNAGLYTGDGASSMSMWGVQLEQRRYPSSYIPTVASTVTRTSDSMSILGGNFSGLINATEGTIVTEVRNIYDYTGKYLNMSDGTANEGYYLERSGTDTVITIVDNSVNQFTETVAGNESDSTICMALAYKANDCQAAVNGVEGTTDISVTLPTTVALTAADPGAGLSYYFRKFRYYNTRRTDLDLLTTI
jgi:hypothetical protein